MKAKQLNPKYESQWGNRGLTRAYLVVPRILLTHNRDFGLNERDVFFIEKVILCIISGTTPYADSALGMEPDKVTRAKRKLIALGYLQDNSKRNPKNPLKIVPSYDLTG